MLADGIIASLLTGSSFNLNYLSFVHCLLLLNVFITWVWSILKELGFVRYEKCKSSGLTADMYWNPGGLWWFTPLRWSVSGHFTCMPHAKEILTTTEPLLPVLKRFYSICEMEVRPGHSHRKLRDLQIKKSCKSLGFCQHWCSLGIQTEWCSCMLAPKSWWRSLGLHPI